MEKNKPIVWQFTSKDLVSYTILVITLCGLYYGIDKRLDTIELKSQAIDTMQDYRITLLEADKKEKIAYEAPKEGILPQAPRVKRPVEEYIN